MEGDHIPKRCFNERAAKGDSCGGLLRIETIISAPANQPAGAHGADTRVLQGVRCERCRAYYLYDPTGGRLLPK